MTSCAEHQLTITKDIQRKLFSWTFTILTFLTTVLQSVNIVRIRHHSDVVQESKIAPKIAANCSPEQWKYHKSKAVRTVASSLVNPATSVPFFKVQSSNPAPWCLSENIIFLFILELGGDDSEACSIKVCLLVQEPLGSLLIVARLSRAVCTAIVGGRIFSLIRSPQTSPPAAWLELHIYSVEMLHASCLSTSALVTWPRGPSLLIFTVNSVKGKEPVCPKVKCKALPKTERPTVFDMNLCNSVMTFHPPGSLG